MKYKKGTFNIIPNTEYLKGKNPTFQAIFFWLCFHSDSNGICYPSRAILSDEVGCDVRTIDRHMIELEREGFIVKTKRKKPKSSENLSNLYQINIIEVATKKTLGVATKTTLPGDKKDTRGGDKNDTVTIPIKNYTHLTILQDDKKALKREEKSNPSEDITLPMFSKGGISTGKNPTDRLLYLYKKLFYFSYKFDYKPNYGRDKKLLLSLLESYSEIQLAYMFCVYFEWNGMNNNNSKEYEFYVNAMFPITMFKTTMNKYEAYSRNVAKVNFDDDVKLLDEVGKLIKNKK